MKNKSTIFLFIWFLMIFITEPAWDQYNGMTKHNNAGMLNNLEPSWSLTQTIANVFNNGPINQIIYVLCDDKTIKATFWNKSHS